MSTRIYRQTKFPSPSFTKSQCTSASSNVVPFHPELALLDDADDALPSPRPRPSPEKSPVMLDHNPPCASSSCVWRPMCVCLRCGADGDVCAGDTCGGDEPDSPVRYQNRRLPFSLARA